MISLENLLADAKKKASALDERCKDQPWTEDIHPGYAHIVCVQFDERHEHFSFWDIEHAILKELEEEIGGATVEIYQTLWNQDERFVKRPGLDVCPSTYIKEWRKHHRYPK